MLPRAEVGKLDMAREDYVVDVVGRGGRVVYVSGWHTTPSPTTILALAGSVKPPRNDSGIPGRGCCRQRIETQPFIDVPSVDAQLFRDLRHLQKGAEQVRPYK